MKIKSINKSWLAILSGSGALALLLLMAILCPICSSEADAAECTDQNPSACPTQSASTKASVNVTTIISVALDSQVDLEVVPDANGQFTSATANLSVSTNSAAGYKVLLSTAGSNNALTGPMVGESRTKIDAIEQNTTKANFPSNTWGYNLGNTSTITDTTVFSSVPISTAQTVIRETDMPSTDNYSLNFGAKVDNTLASGEYSNDIIVSAIANPRKATIADISTMQDMNSEICANTAEGYTKQLIDTRDNKSYWVAKLKDGDCWMTQNLALDLKADTTLTPEDTDILSASSVITVGNNAGDLLPTTFNSGAHFSGSHVDFDDGASWSIENTLLATPVANLGCGYNVEYFGYQCPDYGLLFIDGTWSPTFQAQQGVWTGAGANNGKTIYIAANSSSKTYDMHYLLGNYYTWWAAIGTSDTSALQTSRYSQQSICPKGWRLPNGGSSDNDFTNLYNQYGLDPSLTGTVGGNNYNAAEAPFYLTRGGYIDNYSHSGDYISLDNFGQEGEYWSNSVNDYAYPLTMQIGQSKLSTDTRGGGSGGDPQNGKFVRCVAR